MNTIERPKATTMKGNPLTLLGPERKPGEKLPDFTLVDNGLKPVTAADTAGKVRIFSVVPSLDTPVCDLQTRRFNDEAGKLGEQVKVLTVSMDLPFAQKRWCGAAGATHVQTLSDYQTGSFGQAMGTLIKELRLESRAIFVVDKDGTIRYVQYVPEIGEHPDYDNALAAARALVK
ncbi:MAG TPA: thiol peroxidase [Terriglobales bacterium]|nr:thiol peroxidase [Terriglobales bacterium]